MATYNKCVYNIPAYQEGSLSDFEFDLDVNFPLANVSDITFQARDFKGEAFISRKKSSNEISLVDRTVKIIFKPIDTKGHAGNNLYEIDFIDLQGNPFATIGGAFVISQQINTL